MDLTPEYVALSRDLALKVRARGQQHRWQDGDYIYCPRNDLYALFVSDHADEAHEDDVWLPRLDQLVEAAELFGLDGVVLYVPPKYRLIETGQPLTPEAVLLQRILLVP